MSESCKGCVSDKELVVLALVSEEPIHAYGLEEKIRARQMTDWTAISFSSIYRVLRGLEAKGLLTSELVHEGQGATRKVHDLTGEGRRVLAGGVLDRLGQTEDVKSPFFLAVYALTAAPKDEVLRAIEERVAFLASLDECMSAQERSAHTTLADVLAGLPAHEQARVGEAAELRIDSIFDLARRYRTVEREFLGDTLVRIREMASDRFGDL